MKEKAKFYYLYQSSFFEVAKFILVLLVIGFLALQITRHILPVFPLFFLSVFIMWETFFHFYLAKSSPKLAVSQNTGDVSESCTLKALYFASHEQEVDKLLPHFLRMPTNTLFLEKMGFETKDIVLQNIPKEALYKQALELTKEVNGTYVTSLDVLVSYLLITEEQTKLLFNKKLTKEDLLAILLWQRAENKQEELPEHKRVLFFGEGIGESLVSGWTPETKLYTLDRTGEAVAEIPLTLGREQQLQQVWEGLFNKKQKNVLLVGEPGSGRRTLAYATVFQTMQTHLPKKLSELLLDRLIAGVKDQGELATRLDALVEEVSHALDVILFIPEFQTIVGASGVSVNVSGVLLPYLENGNLPIIATITQENFTTYVEPLKALTEVFTVINIEEPDLQTALAMLLQKSAVLEKQQGVVITYKAIKEAVKTSARYLQDQVLPGAAVRLLQDTSAHAISSSKKVITEDDIVQTIEQKTGVPVGTPSSAEKTELLHLEEILHKKVIGQDVAITQVAEAIRRLRAGLSSQTKPISFLFLGPTGVGKTETAKTLADVYFSGRGNMIRFDMSEYADTNALTRLLGAKPGEGSEKGVLTEQVKEHPFSLILLDEFEKSAPQIRNLFLQVFDDGRLTDNKGKTVSFANTIIIATSNAGSEFIRESVAERVIIDTTFEEKLLEMLQKQGIFAPELLNRFDGVIVFTPIGTEQARKIVANLLMEIAAKMQEKQITVQFDQKIIDYIVTNGLNTEFGVRPLRRFVQEHIDDFLAQKLLSDELKRGSTITLSLDSNGTITTS